MSTLKAKINDELVTMRVTGNKRNGFVECQVVIDTALGQVAKSSHYLPEMAIDTKCRLKTGGNYYEIVEPVSK